MLGKNQIFVCGLTVENSADDRGAAPLSSAKVSNQTDQNLIFFKHLMRRDEGPSQISSDFDGKSELSSSISKLTTIDDMFIQRTGQAKEIDRSGDAFRVPVH